MNEKDTAARDRALGVAVAVVLAVLALSMWRVSACNEQAPGAPTSSLVPAPDDLPEPPPECRDLGCVASLARAYAASLVDAGRAGDAEAVSEVAAALERGDCAAALEKNDALREEEAGAPELLLQNVVLTTELARVCLLGAFDGSSPLVGDDEDD